MNRTCRLFFLALFPCLQAMSQHADINLLKQINVNRNTGLDPTFVFVSNTVTPVSLALPVTVIGTGLVTRNKNLRNQGYEMGVSAASALALTTAIKYSVNRTRPYVTYPFIDNAVTESDPSFPSGHTSAAFATATSLSLNFPKWYVIVPAYAWAGGVAYSRLHLGVHYPSDVAMGAVTGAGSAYLTHKARQWLQKKRQCKPDSNK